MKRSVLFFMGLLLVTIGYCQSVPQAHFVASKHNVCVGESVDFNDDSRNTDPVGRKWIFPDTVIDGTFAGDQLSVYRAFFQEVNPVELHVYHTYIDTIYNADSSDYTLQDAFDTLYYYDTIYAFIHPRTYMKGDSVVCPGDTTNVRIAPIMNGCVYKWYEMYGSTAPYFATGPALKVVPRSNEAMYFVQISSPEGCVAWDSVTVYILQSSLTVLPENGEICAGQPAQLISGKADHYEWQSLPYDSTLVGVSNNQKPTVYPTTTTVYSVTPYGSNGCSGEKKIVSVKVHPLPVPKVKVSPTFIDPDDPVITFRDLSEHSVSSFWSFGVGETAEGSDVEHVFSDFRYDSTEIVLRTTNDMGCYVDTAFRMAIQHFASWAPKVFTPNRAENSTFSIYTGNDLEYFNVYIYNRRGMLVYSSVDPRFVWDGTHCDVDCPQGVYVYICNYRRAGTGDVAQMKGTVLLLR